jgi:RNA polymerase sigma-70 factor (ECF subfamily)
MHTFPYNPRMSRPEREEGQFEDGLRTGDEDAWGRYFKENFAYLKYRAAKMLGRGRFDDAEDLAQETLLSVWKNKEKLNPDKNPRGYFIQTLYHKAIDIYRSHRPEVELNEQVIDSAPFTGSVEDDAMRHLSEETLQAEINEALSKIPEKYREVVIFRAQGYSIEDIVEITGIDANEVKNRIKLGKRMLRRRKENL